MFCKNEMKLKKMRENEKKREKQRELKIYLQKNAK